MKSGYYFVITSYESGRVSYSERRYATARGAEARARSVRKRTGVKYSRVKYQAGQTAVDIKKFI